MQAVTTTFLNNTKAPIRDMTYLCYMSFDKTYNSGTTFFTIGVSTIGGHDIIKGDGNVVQEWDKYVYADYSNRIISIDYDREAQVNPETPVIMGMADIVMDNHDDLFTPSNVKSPLHGKLLPKRPIKLYIGFGVEAIPVFVGLTDNQPVIDDSAKTATFHCLDFLYSLSNVPLDSDVIFVNQTTDQIVGQLLQSAGLSATQYSADVGTVTIPFAYFAKGSKLGDALIAITQAELGRLYMSESGVITFENRTNWNGHSVAVWNFDQSTTLDRTSTSQDNIINVAEVTSNARVVQDSQKIWQLSSPVQIPINSSVDIFADFTDDDGTLPVTSIDTPTYDVDSDLVTESAYETNLANDGTSDTLDSFVSLTAHSAFSTAYKMTFTNSSTVHPIYVTKISLWGTPAKVVNRIYVRQEDTNSTALYDEQVTQINNDYIQDETAAISIAQIILADLSSFQESYTLRVKGVPQLQIGDLVGYSDQNGGTTYFVARINGILDSNGFIQTITIIKRSIHTYFTIGVSRIGGSDIIAP